MKMLDYQLIQRAYAARNNAQAPYSKFYVGCAVRSVGGSIYTGCNVERASYSQTTHGEQNAIDSMVAGEGSVKIKTLAVVAAAANKTVAMPNELSEIAYGPVPCCCGHCLQIIWENSFNDPSIEIYFIGVENRIHVMTIGQLLPYPFGPHDLGISYEK